MLRIHLATKLVTMVPHLLLLRHNLSLLVAIGEIVVARALERLLHVGGLGVTWLYCLLRDRVDDLHLVDRVLRCLLSSRVSLKLLLLLVYRRTTGVILMSLLVLMGHVGFSMVGGLAELWEEVGSVST